MRVRDEELIQFLLGDADQVLRERVTAALAADPQTSKRLEELRAALGLLDSLKLAHEPPDDLVARTMSRIDIDSENAAPAQTSNQSQPHLPEPAVELQRPSIAVGARGTNSSRQFWDSTILSISIVIICCLMLPLMLEARSQSRRLQCAHNLAAIGRGLTELAMMNSQRRLPIIPTAGPEAFAGKHVINLHDAKLLDSPAVVRCPSIAGMNPDSVCVLSIPSREEFCTAPAELQNYWRSRVGGNYAYNLGVLEEGRIAPARLEGRTHFALAGDAVAINGAVLNDVRQSAAAHDGRGFNIFYEDGHVAFVARMSKPVVRVPHQVSDDAPQVDEMLSVRSWMELSDNPFCNTDGDCARGSHPGDSVIGPSAASPLPKRIFLR